MQTNGPHNPRASDLLIRKNTCGPVLLKILRLTKGKNHSVIIDYQIPTEALLQSSDFRKKRVMWNRLCKEHTLAYTMPI